MIDNFQTIRAWKSASEIAKIEAESSLMID